MGITLLAVSALVASASLLVGAVALAARAISRPGPEPAPRIEGEVGLHARLEALELKVAELPSLWEREALRAEEAKQRAEGQYAKARAAESRARRLREESDAGDDDEIPAEWVNPEHGGAGGDERLHAVSEDMERATAEDVRRWAFQNGVI